MFDARYKIETARAEGDLWSDAEALRAARLPHAIDKAILMLKQGIKHEPEYYVRVFDQETDEEVLVLKGHYGREEQ